MIMQEEKGRKLSAWHRALTCALAAAALALTVCAGLVSRTRTAEARMLEGFDAPQHASRVIVRGGARRGDEGKPEEGPAVREVEQATEAVVRFENVASAPLVINEARMRLITQDQLRRADAEGADSFEDEESPFFVTLPTVTLTNVSGKAVREVGIGYLTGGRVNVISGYAVSIKPGEAETFRSDWRRRNVIIPGDFSDVSVRVVWVTFADGTQWGPRAHDPHPPAPPPPPPAHGSEAPSAMSPPPPPPKPTAATGYGSGGDAGGTGGGEGVGEADGRGDGKGDGGGVGVGKSVALKDQIIYAPNPSYPPIAKAAGAEGIVSVRVKVDEDGNVIAAKAVSGHPLLQAAAVDAARASKFKPTFVDGRAVKVAGVISYNFVLDHKDEGPRD